MGKSGGKLQRTGKGENSELLMDCELPSYFWPPPTALVGGRSGKSRRQVSGARFHGLGFWRRVLGAGARRSGGGVVAAAELLPALGSAADRSAAGSHTCYDKRNWQKTRPGCAASPLPRPDGTEHEFCANRRFLKSDS